MHESAPIARSEACAQCFRLTKKYHTNLIIRPDEGTAVPGDFQETKGQYREGGGDDPLYPHAATLVDPGLSRDYSHRQKIPCTNALRRVVPTNPPIYNQPAMLP
ncbi:uncharacterized protein N7496_010658, partial [Penicillium cataractarum]